jgi:hypothetical protein
MQTTTAGVFAAPSLTPADGYALTVEKAGFATWENKSFRVQVGEPLYFHIALLVSSSTTKVVVTSDAALID